MIVMAPFLLKPPLSLVLRYQEQMANFGRCYLIILMATLSYTPVYSHYERPTTFTNGFSVEPKSKRHNLNPVVIVPGTGGNQIEAKLTQEYKGSGLFCRRWYWEKSWFTIWFDISVILPPWTGCFAERMTLFYDPQLDEYRNAPGVETRVPHFGSTKGMQFLDSDAKWLTSYMSKLVESLEEVGYIDGQSLLGAPYDFRYGPGTTPTSVGAIYMQDLKKLVEDAFRSNNGTPVILVSHSLGGLWVHHLLKQQTKAWKNKYIKRFIAIATPWGGTVQGMRTFASGYSLRIPTVNPLVVREEQRSSESNMWILPFPEVFGNQTLVTREDKHYTAMDMKEFLKDIGFEEGLVPYQSRIRPLIGHLVAPGVPVTIIHGNGVKTPELLRYDGSGFDKQPVIIEGDGDGTVNLCSLTAVVADWSATSGQDVKVYPVQQGSHEGILKDPNSIQIIVEEILKGNSTRLYNVI